MLIAIGLACGVRSPAADPVSYQQVLSEAESLFVSGRLAQARERFEFVRTTVSHAGEPRRLRDRERCSARLAEIARRLGERDEALRIALEQWKHLEREPNTEDVQTRRRIVARQLAEDHLALGNVTESAALLADLLANRFGKLTKLERLDTLELLGTTEATRGRSAEAKQAWSAVVALAHELLDDKSPLFPVDRYSCGKPLAAAHDGLGEPAAADDAVRRLLAVADTLPDKLVKRSEAWQHLFSRSIFREDDARAEAYLRQSLAEPLAQRSALASADLWWTLSALQRRIGRHADAQKSASESLGRYEQVVSQPAPADQFRSPLDRLACLKRLRFLYQQADRLSDALAVATQVRQLAEELQPGPDAPESTSARAAQAELLAALGDYDSALPLLRDMVAGIRKAREVETTAELKLARALNNLSAVERAGGHFSAAVAGLEEALGNRERRLSPDDPDLATSYRNLASVYTSLGQFARAIELHRRVLEQCQRRGVRADSLRSSTLLELAIAHRTQGQFRRATALCGESLALQQSLVGPEHFSTVAHHNALAALARLDRRFEESVRHSETVLRICRATGREHHEQAAAAHRNLGIVRYDARQWDAAHEHWRRALDIHHANGQSLPAAQTWNRLGMLAHRQGHLAEARANFEAARKLLADPSARPIERYSVLCNLAQVLHDQHEFPAALDLLRQAVELVEVPRAGTDGAERQRAEFFSQFSSAFDMLVDWSLEEERFDSAFEAAERSRNRTFLDQLRLAGVDLRQTLTGDDGRRLVEREAELRARVQSLRVRSQAVATGPNRPDDHTAITRALEQAQREYAQAWINIRRHR